MSAQTFIIPSITASERYDTNVFWAPKSLLSPDKKPEDFITTVIPQLNISHAGSLVRGTIFGTGLITRYMHNPELDFTGYNAGGRFELKDAVNKVSQRITLLTVTGTYRSVPATTGFGTAGGSLGQGFGSTTPGGPLDTGQVTNRASRQIYTLGVTGGYQLTQLTTMSANYSYSHISFGEQSGGVNNSLFDTTSHLGSTAISTRISPRDTVGATATMAHYIQEQSGGSSGQGTFTTISETLNWNRLWTQELSTFLSGGAIYRLPVDSAIPGQAVSSQVQPTAMARITYSSFYEGLRDTGPSVGPFDGLPSLPGSLSPGGSMAPGAYTASMSYRYSIFPSYAFGSGPMQTHVVGANANAGITSKLSVLAGMNYAHGSRSSPSFSFDSVGLTAGASYLIGPVLASLTYNWFYYSKLDAASLSQSSEYEYSKRMVLLAFSFAFTSPGQSFFTMGGFGSTGTQGSGEGISAPSGTGTGSSPSGDGSGVLR